tara:strand:- start:2409 stop:3701 length:1293 start_codon:yes stop_codon:yes gene_type:complete
MDAFISADRLRFLIHRLRERLWVRPLVVCLLSVGAAFVAKLADDAGLEDFVPEISLGSIQTLLSIMASSMLVIATFSVSSMVSAYASASSTATPRSFGLVVADDVSQNALSTFVGAFIFSIVALMAAKNAYFEKAGIFVLFSLTAFVFGIVIFTFVRWVDSVARLGRIGSTIDKVEKATADALKLRQKTPHLCGLPVNTLQAQAGQPVYATQFGYVQHIDMSTIQAWAEEADIQVVIAALPGTLATPDRALAYVSKSSNDQSDTDFSCVIESFQIGNDRLFEDDPRFGLVVLSEIAGRALSPAVNDPGTAISVIGAQLRLFILWTNPAKDCEAERPEYDRITVPTISINDMFDDAFTAIARDGAGIVEVAVRLQKTLGSLALIGHSEMRDAALYHGQLALKRAEKSLDIDEDLAIVRDAASYLGSVNNQT